MKNIVKWERYIFQELQSLRCRLCHWFGLFWSFAEDNGIPFWRQPEPPPQEKRPKQGFSAWQCLFQPYARQPTGNARNARLLLNRRPCSTYWLLVGRATGTMSKMSSHTIGTRHLWLLSYGKNERFTFGTFWDVVLPLTHWERCCSRLTSLTSLGHVWKAEEKVPPESKQAVPFGWFKWPLITFSQPLSLYWYSSQTVLLIICFTSTH